MQFRIISINNDIEVQFTSISLLETISLSLSNLKNVLFSISTNLFNVKTLKFPFRCWVHIHETLLDNERDENYLTSTLETKVYI